MLGGARLPRRRRQQQPRLWLMNAEPPPPPPPPWLWMVPGSAGLLRPGPGVAPPRVLLASARPPAAPLLPGLPAWQAPGEPLLPLLPLPAAPDHAAAAGHPCALPPGQVTRPCPHARPRPHPQTPGHSRSRRRSLPRPPGCSPTDARVRISGRNLRPAGAAVERPGSGYAPAT